MILVFTTVFIKINEIIYNEVEFHKTKGPVLVITQRFQNMKISNGI